MTSQRREQIRMAAEPVFTLIRNSVTAMHGEHVGVCIIYCDADDLLPWTVRVGNYEESTVTIEASDVNQILLAWHNWGKKTTKEAIEMGVLS